MSNNIQNSELVDIATKSELLRIMECPVCNELPFPPIYQCVRGHIVCKNCKSKLTECPTCRGLLSEARNYTVEQMVLASKHSCCYKRDGCPIELRGELMENHITNCSYRPFKCPWFGHSTCSTDFLRLTLAKDHICNVHSVLPPSVGPTKMINYQLFSFKHFTGEGSLRRLKDNIVSIPTAIEFDGKVFCFVMFSMNQTICFSVLCVGSEVDAQKYRVKIICQPDKENEIQWTTPVKSVVKGAELMNTATRHNVFISSCTLDDLIQMAEIGEGHYEFATSCTILKRKCK